MKDVRELIPEFYYLPDFLENRNDFDFGATQVNDFFFSIIVLQISIVLS